MLRDVTDRARVASTMGRRIARPPDTVLAPRPVRTIARCTMPPHHLLTRYRHIRRKTHRCSTATTIIVEEHGPILVVIGLGLGCWLWSLFGCQPLSVETHTTQIVVRIDLLEPLTGEVCLATAVALDPEMTVCPLLVTAVSRGVRLVPSYQ